jgi:hypothetical protein
MAKSPCIGCELEAADKNNPTCRECDRRVEYMALIAGDASEIKPGFAALRPGRQKKREYHKSTIEEKGKGNKECLIKECDEEVYCRGLCRNHYQQWYKGYIGHPVLGKYKVAQPKKNKLKGTAMNNIDKIRELTRDLERGCDKMSGGMNLEIARQMLVVSECITAGIQGYLLQAAWHVVLLQVL